MARQTGIIKLKGTIGDISFYKSADGHLARYKGGVDANRIAMILRFRELVKMALSLDVLEKEVK